MSATTLTFIVSVSVAIIGSIIIPLTLNYVKDRQRDAHADSLDSRSVAAMFKAEKETLQVRLDKVTAEYEGKLAALKAEYERKLAESEAKYLAQIAGLRAEVDGLYRRLYSAPPGA